MISFHFIVAVKLGETRAFPYVLHV